MTFLSFMNDFGSIILTLILGIVYALIWLISKKRHGKFNIGDFYMQVPELVAEAEDLFKGEKMGGAKLNHVVTQLSLQALQNGFKLDVDKIVEMVNKIVETSKTVNIFPQAKPIEPAKKNI